MAGLTGGIILTAIAFWASLLTSGCCSGGSFELGPILFPYAFTIARFIHEDTALFIVGAIQFPIYGAVLCGIEDRRKLTALVIAGLHLVAFVACVAAGYMA